MLTLAAILLPFTSDLSPARGDAVAGYLLYELMAVPLPRFCLTFLVRLKMRQRLDGYPMTKGKSGKAAERLCFVRPLVVLHRFGDDGRHPALATWAIRNSPA